MPRLMMTVWSLLAAAFLAGCGDPAGARLYDAGLIRDYAHARGLETGETVHCWNDPAGRNVFVLASATASLTPAAQRDSRLMVLSADRAEPLIIDLRGVNLYTQWVDASGRVWDRPAFAAAMGTGCEIDRSSGLFIRYDPRDPSHAFSVGRMNHPEGWLFHGTLPESVDKAVYVKAKHDDIVIAEHWNFKVHGAPSPRAHYWVYSPDPKCPGSYIQTDSYWQEQWTAIPSDKVRLRLDGDWLVPRLTSRSCAP